MAAVAPGLPEEEQRRLVEAGPKEAWQEGAGAARACGGVRAGEVGVVAACRVYEREKENAGGEGIALLWVATSGLEDAIAALST